MNGNHNVIKLLVLFCLIIVSPAFAEPPPKETVPDNIPDKIRAEIESLKSSNKKERLKAVIYLQNIGDEALPALSYVKNALKDEDWRVRIEVIYLLASIGDDEAIETIKRLEHEDPFPAVKRAARLALMAIRKRLEKSGKEP